MKDSPKTILSKFSMEEMGNISERPLPKQGEKLSYLVKYLWIIPVAVAEIEVGEQQNYKNHRVYPVTAKGKTTGFISSLVKAEGVITSFIDTGKLYPWRYEEKAHAEGHRPSNKVILYNQNDQIMEFKDIKRKIPKNTQDPLSALFYLRWQEYEEGKRITFNVNSNKENYTLNSQLVRNDAVALKDGQRKILIIDSEISSPKEYSKSEAKITTYVTDDNARIPVLIKVRTKFGPVTCRLLGVEGR